MAISSFSQRGLQAPILRRTLLPAAGGSAGGSPTGGMILNFYRNWQSISYVGLSTNNEKMFFQGVSATGQTYGDDAWYALISADGSTVNWAVQRENMPNLNYWNSQGGYQKWAATGGNGDCYISVAGMVHSGTPDYVSYVQRLSDVGGTSQINEGRYFEGSNSNTFPGSVSAVPGDSNNRFFVSYFATNASNGFQPNCVAMWNGTSLSWVRWENYASSNYANFTMVAADSGANAWLFTTKTISDTEYNPMLTKFNSAGSYSTSKRWKLSAPYNYAFAYALDVATDGSYAYCLWRRSDGVWVTKVAANESLVWNYRLNDFSASNYIGANIHYSGGKLYITGKKGQYVKMDASTGNIDYSRRMFSQISNLNGSYLEGDWLYFFGHSTTSTYSGGNSMWVFKIPKDGSQSGLFDIDGSPVLFETDSVTAISEAVEDDNGPISWQTPNFYTTSGYQSHTVHYTGTINKAGI